MTSLIKRFLKSPAAMPVILITFFTFFSRFLGFIRQYFILRNLDTLDSDLLLSANKIPEIISVVLLMGTIYSSVLPIASKLETNDEENQKVSTYLNLITFSLVVIIIVLILIALIFTEPILKLFTSQEIWTLAEQNGALGEYILVSRILLISPLAFSLQAIWGVFLTLKKKFLIYSLAGVVTNIGTIIALMMTDGDFVKVGIGMVWGGIMASLLFLWGCLQSGYIAFEYSQLQIFKNFKTFKAEIIQTWKLFLPRIFVIDGFYAASFIINPIAQNSGQITAFDIGTSIQGSFFVIITSLSTVFFPDLSKTLHITNLRSNIFWDKMSKYLKISLGLGVLVTILTIIGSPVIMLIYSLLGKNENQDIGNYIVLIAQITALSLVFRSIREILSKYIYVRQKVWEPVILSTASLITSILITYILLLFKVDAGIATSLGFIGYNFVWVLIAYFNYLEDRKKYLN
jgi:peptidoglycan biosynthesis protein MviN/MurJ (putative lipid II flippase)